MEAKNVTAITISATVQAPVEKVWTCWNEPQHITQWNAASDDWHSPYAENDLREGGKLKVTMAAKDGSFSFDFGGVYTKVEPFKTIAYTLGDGRKVSVSFTARDQATEIVETFDAENENPEEMQRSGWQAILDNFKKYVEGLL